MDIYIYIYIYIYIHSYTKSNFVDLETRSMIIIHSNVIIITTIQCNDYYKLLNIFICSQGHFISSDYDTLLLYLALSSYMFHAQIFSNSCGC